MALTPVLILLSSIKVHLRKHVHARCLARTFVRLVIAGCRLLRCLVLRPAACVLHDDVRTLSAQQLQEAGCCMQACVRC